MTKSTELDVSAFRSALSRFATGIGVVTTLDSQGKKVGITVSSFNSVSLDPPLILWSIGLDSMSYDVFTEVDFFAVHILTRDQEELCDRFAQRGNDKFASFECGEGINGVPILPDFAACFECSTEHIYPGGDHKIIVGRVHDFEERETEPLIYYRSRFLRNGSAPD